MEKNDEGWFFSSSAFQNVEIVPHLLFLHMFLKIRFFFSNEWLESFTLGQNRINNERLQFNWLMYL